MPVDDASHVRVVCTFAPSRGWVVGSGSGGGGGGGGGGTGGGSGTGGRERRYWDALYVMSSSGSLIEYHVEPRPAGGGWCGVMGGYWAAGGGGRRRTVPSRPRAAAPGYGQLLATTGRQGRLASDATLCVGGGGSV